jgi:hypothetical protein
MHRRATAAGRNPSRAKTKKGARLHQDHHAGVSEHRDDRAEERQLARPAAERRARGVGQRRTA